MADPKRVVQQWLRTDAAFGMTAVPLRKPRRAVTTRATGSAGSSAAPAGKAAPTGMAAVHAFVRQAASPPPRAEAPPRQPAPPPAAPRPPAVAAAAPRQEAPTPRAKKPSAEIPIPQDAIAALPPLTSAQKQARMAALQAEAQDTLKPFFNDHATRLVFGEGSLDAKVVFIGEGPGVDENAQGRPFVGKSGKKLDEMIAAMGLKREDIYIANVVKLRSADYNDVQQRAIDRPPTEEEVARNIGFLHRQLEIIRPRVIVTLGAPAAVHITGDRNGITKIRGTWHTYRGIPVMPTFHPAYLLRSFTLENQRAVWQDLQAVMKKLQDDQ